MKKINKYSIIEYIKIRHIEPSYNLFKHFITVTRITITILIINNNKADYYFRKGLNINDRNDIIENSGLISYEKKPKCLF